MKRGKGGLIAALIVLLLALACGVGAVLYVTGGARFPERGWKPAEGQCGVTLEILKTKEKGTSRGERASRQEALVQACLERVEDRVKDGDFPGALQALDNALEEVTDVSRQEELKREQVRVYRLWAAIRLADEDYVSAVRILREGGQETGSSALAEQEAYLLEHVVCTRKVRYDAAGVMREEDVRDAAGNKTKNVTYDFEGNVLLRIEWEYDAAGDVTKHTTYGPNGYVVSRTEWRRERDAAGNLTKSVQCGSDGSAVSWEEWEYDAAGNKTKWVKYEPDPEGSLTRWNEWEYDAAGREVKYVSYDRNGNVDWQSVTEYDAAGNKVKEVEYNSHGIVDWQEVTERDAAGNEKKRITSFYSADGSPIGREEWEYDAAGNLATYVAVDAAGKETEREEWEHDAAGNLMKHVAVDGSGAETFSEWERDAAGKETKYVSRDAQGKVERWEEWEYDAAGNKVKYVVLNPDGSVFRCQEWEYDASGNKVKYVASDPEGNETGWEEWRYDASGRETQYFSYGADGKIRMQRATEYDSMGNPVREKVYDVRGRQKYRDVRYEYRYVGEYFPDVAKGRAGETEPLRTAVGLPVAWRGKNAREHYGKGGSV